MKLSGEQEEILNYGGHMLINAGAGTGKTTTCAILAQKKPQMNFIYLSFNRRNMTDARDKFNSMGLTNIKAQTLHSLALDYSKEIGRKINLKKGDWKAYEVVKVLGIKRTTLMANEDTPLKIADHAMKYFSCFCNSALPKIQQLKYSDILNDEESRKFYDEYKDLIRTAGLDLFRKMYNEEIEINFDFLLKIYQLSSSKLQTDCVILDEAQDSCDAILSIFERQECIKIAVGDHHQSVYSFRFAVDSMKKLDHKKFNLTGSFRFGKEIAYVANNYLKWKEVFGIKPDFEIRGLNENTEYDPSDIAFLARKNSGLFKQAIHSLDQYGENLTYNFEGGLNGYLFSDLGVSVYDVVNIGEGNRGRVKSTFAKSCKDIDDLRRTAKELNDITLKTFCDLYDTYKGNLLGYIASFKEKEVKDGQKADLNFSTVHKAKGREYNVVELCDDFFTLEELYSESRKKVSSVNIEEEINILYVACTRAKYKVIMGQSLNPLSHKAFK